MTPIGNRIGHGDLVPAPASHSQLNTSNFLPAAWFSRASIGHLLIESQPVQCGRRQGGSNHVPDTTVGLPRSRWSRCSVLDARHSRRTDQFHRQATDQV